MKLINTLAALAAGFVLSTGVARADADADTVKLFKNAGDSAEYFSRSAGYAVFPTIGKGGIGIGGAYGKGSVYAHGKRTGQCGGADSGCLGQCRYRRWRRQRQWRQESCDHRRWLLQRHGGVHHRQGRPDVRGRGGRTEV